MSSHIHLSSILVTVLLLWKHIITTASYEVKKEFVLDLIRVHESRWGVAGSWSSTAQKTNKKQTAHWEWNLKGHFQWQTSPAPLNPLPNSYQLGPKYSNAGDLWRTCHSNGHTQKQIKMKCLELPWVVKLKSAGVSRPFGSLTFGSRNSSKNECAQASSGVNRAVGVYSSRRLHSAIASGGVRGRKTWKDKEVERTIKFSYKNLAKKSFEYWVNSHYIKTWL